MTEVMLLSDWLKYTNAGFTKPRSTQLKAVDEALKQYHLTKSPAAFSNLQGALLKWIQKEGANWKNSIRNRNGNAVDTLYRQTIAVKNVKQTGEEMVALSSIREESRAIIIDLFAGKRLEYRPGLLTKIAGNNEISKMSARKTIQGVVSDGRTLVSSAMPNSFKGMQGRASNASGANAQMFSSKLFNAAVPAGIAEQVKQLLISAMPDFFAKWAASLAPFSGVLTSASGPIISAAGVLKNQWALSNSRMHSQRTFSADEPEQAFRALIELLERERNSSIADLSISVAEFGGKMAGILVDAGTVTNTAVSFAAGVAKLLLLIAVAVRDITEKNVANELMTKPNVDAKLFAACPVMGAYFICCVPTSVIVNVLLSSDKFYQPGMMDKVEHAVKNHIHPLREKAKTFVKEYRLLIPELANSPGLLDVNNKKLKQMMASKGKTAIGQDFISSS